MIPKKIQSTRNNIVKEALTIRVRRSRFKHRAFLIDGPHLIESALASEGRCEIKKLFYTEEFAQKHLDLMKRLLSLPLELYEVKTSVLDKLSETETPQGITAVASYRAPQQDALRKMGIIVVMDGVQDPGNVGTIIRTSDAAGASTVVLLPGSSDPFSPKALRASAGSVFSIPVLYEDRDALVDKLRHLNIPIVTTQANATQSLFAAEFKPPLALAFGNESRGISPELIKASSMAVRVPIKGGAESLNVASTAAICIYEALRQQMA